MLRLLRVLLMPFSERERHVLYHAHLGMAVEAFARLELLIDTAVENAWRVEANRRYVTRGRIPRLFGAKMRFLEV